MRFFPDQPNRLVPVTWYFVPDDRPFIPWPHAFYCRNWDVLDDDEDPPIGEMNAPRPWYGGTKPATAGDSGICGTPQQWQQGCDPDTPIPGPWPGSLVCSRCGPPPQRSIGGSGTGGPQRELAGCTPDLVVPDLFAAVFQGPDAGGLTTGTVIPMVKGDGPCAPDPGLIIQAVSAPFDWFGDTVQLYWGCNHTADPASQFLYVFTTSACGLPSANTDYFPHSNDPFSVVATTTNIDGGPWPPGSFTFLLQPAP